MKSLRIIACMVALSLLLAATVAWGATCPIRFRVWEGEGDVWFEHGETVRVSATEPRPRLAVYVKVGRNNVVASSEWGYPRDFGFKSVRAAEVADHLRFVRQNAGDIEAGRLRFTSVAAGETALGYRIVGVTEPGSLLELPESCRVGEVRIEIVAEEDDSLLDDERMIDLCQDAMRERFTGLSETELDFKTAEIELPEEPEAIVAGTVDLVAAGRRSQLAYQCRVNRSSGEVIEAEYRTP